MDQRCRTLATDSSRPSEITQIQNGKSKSNAVALFVDFANGPHVSHEIDDLFAGHRIKQVGGHH